MKTIPHAPAALLVVGFALTLSAQSVPLVLRGPYLQSGTVSNIIVRWRTDLPTETSVRYGTGLAHLTAQSIDPAPTTEHEATLEGLIADTTYFYEIEAGGLVLVGGAPYTFTTPPAHAKPTRIWAIGDAGTASIGSVAPLLVRDSYLNYAGSRHTDVWLMLGDNAYPSGTDAQYQEAVFEVFQDLLRTTPLWPTLGNHETYGASPSGQIAYPDIFSLPQDGRAGGVPSGNERYYSFDYGNIHFVCLDSEISARDVGGTMLTWLEQDLVANTKDWLIAYWHSPPYSKGSHDSDLEPNLFEMRERAVPILESYGADLVLCGHSHSYERSFLLNGHYGPSGSLAPHMVLDSGSGQPEATGAYLKSSTSGGEQGTVYVVAGCSGQTEGGFLNHPAMFISLDRLGSVVIDVESNRLSARFLRENGLVEDQFTVLKGDQAPTILTPPANRTVVEGNTATFRVVATGTRPLYYQWLFNGEPLAGASNATLKLINVQMAQAGNYLVVISNVLGSITSPEAVLSVNARPPCAVPPAGLAAWWPLDETAKDSVTANHGTLNGIGEFAPAMVGSGFLFDGRTTFVEIQDDQSLDFADALTVELWFRKDEPYVLNTQSVLFDKRDLAGRMNYGASLSLNFGLTLFFGDPSAGGYQAASAPLPTIGEFHHFAGSYRQADAAHVEAKVYLDGQLVKTALWVGTLANSTTTTPLYLGSARGVSDFFRGVLDEVSIYSRALSNEEVQRIYDAGPAGKCTSPTAPRIVVNPTGQTALLGSTVSFQVFAEGTAPLRYQWLFNSAGLDGATNATLTVSHVGSAQVGRYSVIVSNAFGVATSAEAELTLSSTPQCAPAPPGLVAWWKLAGDAQDSVGPNHGVSNGGATFTPAKVGQGLLLNGTSAFVSIPSGPALDFANNLTVELWFRKDSPYTPNVQYILFDKRDVDGRLNYGASLSVNFGVMLYYGDPAAGGYQSVRYTPLPTVGEFHHFAGTYRQSDPTHVEMNIYLDGQPVKSGVLPGILARTLTSTPLYLGSARGLSDFFPGILDEVSVYNRVLSDAEIRRIYESGAAGKCEPVFAPRIVDAPASQNVIEGATVNFSVTAEGTEPLSYQWLYQDLPLAEATERTLFLPNVQLSQAGRYAVAVSNAVGVVTSAVATLTVSLPPPVVQAVSVQAGAGGAATVAIELVANGTENALGFSLNFNPTILSLSSAELSESAPPDTAMVANQDQAAAGRLGLAVALPAGVTWPRGTQALLRVHFNSSPVPNPITTPLTFGDAPTLRQVSDREAKVLPSVFTDGTVTLLAASFEGDVAPRPGGDRSLTVIDWVQLGRYVAGLDSIGSANEFQRADCAPRSQSGNGVVGVTDWVQVGRYATGLDPLSIAGGPSGEPGPNPGFQAQMAAEPAARTVRIEDVLLLSGATSNVPVTLTAQGNENAFGFSVTFDPVKLRFLNATRGRDAVGGLLNVNTNQADTGHIGLALALPTGRVLTAGEQELVVLRFGVDAAAWGTTSVSFNDSPVRREMSDATAEPLSATYNGALLNLKAAGLVLSHNRSGRTLLLSWPIDGSSGFELETSPQLSGGPWTRVDVVPIPIGLQFLVTLPINEEQAYYRMHKR